VEVSSAARKADAAGGASAVVLTRPVKEKVLDAAIRELEGTDKVRGPVARLRVRE
jgi:hypothetical protein